MRNVFVFEICKYISAIISDLDFGQNTSTLKIGELIRGTNGVYAVAIPSSVADLETPIEEYSIDFWSRFENSDIGFKKLQAIYDAFHRMRDYETDNFYIYYSYAVGQVEDQDKDAEGCKLFRLGVTFTCRNKNLIS